MSDTVFEFDLLLTEADRQHYYITRWDRARKITVRGASEKEACARAVAVLGEPRPGRYWVYRCDGIREVVS